MDLDVAGRRISVAEHGRGEPMVLVHSSGLGGAQWRRVVEALAPRFRLLVPDLIGYGGSDPWPAGVEVSADADEAVVGAVLAAAGSPVHLVGHSYGGLLALHAALATPSRVRTLTLYEPVAFDALRFELPAAEAEAHLAALDRALGGEAGRHDGAAVFVGRLVDYWSGPGAWAGLGDARRAPFLATAEKVEGEVRSLMRDRLDRAQLAAFEAPTLTLSGGTTREVATRVCAILADTVRNGAHVVLEDAGHMGPITHADVVAGLIAHHASGDDAGR